MQGTTSRRTPRQPRSSGRFMRGQAAPTPTRRSGPRQPRSSGTFMRGQAASAQRRRPELRRPYRSQRQPQASQGMLGQLARFAPQFMGGSGSARGRGRAPAGPLGFISGLASAPSGRSSRRRGKGPAMLTGLLGAGAAGTALIRKRRANRAPSQSVQPPHEAI